MTTNLKYIKCFTEALQKLLKDFAKKQAQQTSCVLEPSTPFHTSSVYVVDADDIANDKIRRHDLILKVTFITKRLQTDMTFTTNRSQYVYTA